MLKRGLIVVVALTSACKKDKDAAPTKAATDNQPAVAVKPPPKIDGPSVTPTVTSSITFFTPKGVDWWGEMAFPCYAAAIRLQPGNDPSSAFTQISPLVAPAMKAADIDLDHDVAAFGLWSCGEGACLYTALTLRHPEKIPDMLAMFVPGVKPKQVGKDSYTLEAPGEQGPRTLHIQAVPIGWPSPLPADSWSKEAAKATHILFVTGLFGKSTEVDPLSVMADAQTAAARVKDVEGVVPDAHGMCVRGAVANKDFQPGFKLDKSRFAFVAPEGKGDALGELLGSTRSLDLEVELGLTPAPTPKAVDGWIAQARAWLGMTMEPVRQQFGAGNPLVDVIFEVGALIGNKGFHHDIKGNALVLSWRTDRISHADLAGVEGQLEGAMKSAGMTLPQ